MDLISRKAIMAEYCMRYESGEGRSFVDNINRLPSAFEGMTNGDIFFMMFPDLRTIHASTGAIEIANNKCNIMASREWLDSPYKEG